tara:strand:- start:297 stop:509 length:213 start_codon:yes stop_codon:yes gene_type:complete
VNLEFIELDLDWPPELGVLELKDYILSKLLKFGEPLRWAITSITTSSEKEIQIISVEVVLIVDQDMKGRY